MHPCRRALAAIPCLLVASLPGLGQQENGPDHIVQRDSFSINYYNTKPYSRIIARRDLAGIKTVMFPAFQIAMGSDSEDLYLTTLSQFHHFRWHAKDQSWQSISVRDHPPLMKEANANTGCFLPGTDGTLFRNHGSKLYAWAKTGTWELVWDARERFRWDGTEDRTICFAPAYNIHPIDRTSVVLSATKENLAEYWELKGQSWSLRASLPYPDSMPKPRWAHDYARAYDLTNFAVFADKVWIYFQYLDYRLFEFDIAKKSFSEVSCRWFQVDRTKPPRSEDFNAPIVLHYFPKSPSELHAFGPLINRPALAARFTLGDEGKVSGYTQVNVADVPEGGLFYRAGGVLGILTEAPALPLPPPSR